MLSLMHLIHHVVHMYIKYIYIYIYKTKKKKKDLLDQGHWAFKSFQFIFFALGALGLLSNLFLKTFLLFLQRIQIFSKAFFSKEHKKIHLTKLLPDHDD